MQTLLTALRAVAEPTRLRLLSLCAASELTVSELVQILGQSQPRVSRHLRQLCDAGLLDRFREGNWVFYRVADADGASEGGLAALLAGLVPQDDGQVARDHARLAQVKDGRRVQAAAYFRAVAGEWDHIRSLYVDEVEIERALDTLFPREGLESLLDIGTGTGRILERLGPRVRRAVGVDLSHEMLTIARATLERAGLSHCQVRRADMYRLPMDDASFDAVTIHQVLHYAEEPAEVIAEAARVLRPGGRMAIVDFAPHELEVLRDRHAHRRLGFAADEMAAWLGGTGLIPARPISLAGGDLTVMLWPADKPALRGGASAHGRHGAARAEMEV